MAWIYFIIGMLKPATAYAVSITDPQYGWQCTGFLYCGQGQSVIGVIGARIIDVVNYVIFPLATAVFFYGAIMMITSMGEERKETGKKAMIYAILGIIFGLLTDVIINNIGGFITLLTT